MGQLDFGKQGSASGQLSPFKLDANSSTQLKVAESNALTELTEELSNVNSRITLNEKNLEAALNKFEKDLWDNFTKRARAAEARLDELDEKLDETRVKNVEVLAVFVGLFTFVSVDFQILRKTPDWMAAVGLIWISVGMLLGFVLLTDFVLTGAYRRLSTYKEMGGQFLLQFFKLVAILVISFFCIHKGMKLFEEYKRQTTTPEEREASITTNQPNLMIEKNLELNIRLPSTGDASDTR